MYRYFTTSQPNPLVQQQSPYQGNSFLQCNFPVIYPQQYYIVPQQLTVYDTNRMMINNISQSGLQKPQQINQVLPVNLIQGFQNKNNRTSLIFQPTQIIRQGSQVLDSNLPSQIQSSNFHKINYRTFQDKQEAKNTTINICSEIFQPAVHKLSDNFNSKINSEFTKFELDEMICKNNIIKEDPQFTQKFVNSAKVDESSLKIQKSHNPHLQSTQSTQISLNSDFKTNSTQSLCGIRGCSLSNLDFKLDDSRVQSTKQQQQQLECQQNVGNNIKQFSGIQQDKYSSHFASSVDQQVNPTHQEFSNVQLSNPQANLEGKDVSKNTDKNNNNIIAISQQQNDLFDQYLNEVEGEDVSGAISNPFSIKGINKEIMQNIGLRKDVIIKNILRDIRKYYSIEFNNLTNFNKKKRSKVESMLDGYLLEYVQANFPNESAANSAPTQQQSNQQSQMFTNSNLTEYQNNLAFSLGCLIQPKRMLKRKDLSVIQRAEVLKTYKTLYQYRNEYLDNFLKNKSNTQLLEFYLRANSMERILSKNQNRSQQQTYEEAVKYLIKRSRQLVHSTYLSNSNSIINKQQSSQIFILSGSQQQEENKQPYERVSLLDKEVQVINNLGMESDFNSILNLKTAHQRQKRINDQVVS
eukprot:403373627